MPDAAGRYYVMQFADAWTNDFLYVGTRATGTAAGEFVIVGPGWEGELPAGMPVIHAPTKVFSIVGRWAVAGHDLAVVHAAGPGAVTAASTKLPATRGPWLETRCASLVPVKWFGSRSCVCFSELSGGGEAAGRPDGEWPYPSPNPRAPWKRADRRGSCTRSARLGVTVGASHGVPGAVVRARMGALSASMIPTPASLEVE